MDEVMVVFAVLVAILLILVAILRSFDRAEVHPPRPSLWLPVRKDRNR